MVAMVPLSRAFAALCVTYAASLEAHCEHTSLLQSVPHGQQHAVIAGFEQAPHTSSDVQGSMLYLISSYPNLRQVAYLHLPDNVWRPLVVGEIEAPRAVAVDPLHSKLYVSDPPQGKIFSYNLLRDEGNGLLMTDGHQHVAVEGFEAHWMSVDGVGDLYFTGKEAVAPPQSSYDAIYRHDWAQLEQGVTINPNEVYSRPNSGNPNPRVWMPSGIAVDSFFVYWANQERGADHGSVVKGSRQNLGGSAEAVLSTLTSQNEEVRGMAATGTLLYYVTPDGVYAIPKTGTSASLLSPPPPENDENEPWDPRSIAWDGGGTLYFTDNMAGRIYSVPAGDTLPHDITRFADAPGVHGVTILQLNNARSAAARIAEGLGFWTLVVSLAAALHF